MPLSDREQKLLDDLERSFSSSNSRLPLLDLENSPSERRRIYLVLVSTLIALTGMAVLIGAVALKFPPAGILGFLIMLGGGLLYPFKKFQR